MKNVLIPKNLAKGLLIAVTVGLLAAGCAPQQAQPRGWAGAVISEGSAIVLTMEGKLAVIDIASRSRSRADIPVEGAAPPAGFGCAASATTVAVYGTPAVSGKVAYIGGYDGRLHAVGFGPNPPESWQYPAKDSASLQPIAGGVVMSPGVIYFGSSDGNLYAVNTVGHDLKWKFATGDKIWSTPVIDGGVIYIGSFDRKLYAVNISDGSKKWEFATEGAITGTVLVYNQTVYVGTFDRYVYAIDAATGTLKWKSAVQADRWFWTGPVVANDTIYAGSLDGKVYALSAKDGSRTAVLDLRSPISAQPVVMDDSVVVASQDGKVYTINSRNNEMKTLTTIEETNAPLVASDGVVYIHSQKNETFYALNAQTGVKMWSLLLYSK